MDDASHTLRRWSSRVSAKIAPLVHGLPVLPADAKLREGLLIGDEILVLEALQPRTRTLTASKRPPAELTKGFQDDTVNGFETLALDYLLQGMWSKALYSSRRSTRRVKSTAPRREALLQRLWRHPVLGPILQMQLENVSFTILPAEDPQETHLWLMSPSVLHRAALASPSNAEVLESLAKALHWHPWRVISGFDAPDRDDFYMPSHDLRSCRDFCIRHGFSGFFVQNGYAYFRRTLGHFREAKAGVLHLAPGPSSLSQRSLAALLLGQTALERETAMDVALQTGAKGLVRALGQMGCEISDDGRIGAEKMVLERILLGGQPPWLHRAVQSWHGSEKAQDGIVLENPEEIRNHTQKEVFQLQMATRLPLPVCAKILRHFGRAELAIAEFHRDPQAVLRSNGVPSLAGEARREDGGVCGICFEPSGELQKWLPCRGIHPFCDACLRHYLQGLLDSGNVSGMVCPEPTCRLPLDDTAVAALLGPVAREKFVKISAALDVAARPGHIAWCPQPGCGKAVARSGGLTVRCACGYRFCCGCKLPGGHEPCSCEQWKAWIDAHPQLEQQQKERKKHLDRDEVWIRRNAQHCPGCRGVVERNGGCNHMICRCGVHFCYVCGRLWQEHETQRGGMDFFNCRLPKAHTHRSGSKTQSSEGFAEDPIAEFQALERNVACAQRWAMEAGSLLQAFHHVLSLPTPSSPSSQAVRMEPQLSSTLREAVEVLVNAQRTMRCCWVFRWHASTQQLETGPMEFWLGEFQTACSTLEAALGPSFQAAWQSHMPHLEASEQRWPLLESSSGDLHDVMWRLEALELSAGSPKAFAWTGKISGSYAQWADSWFGVRSPVWQRTMGCRWHDLGMLHGI
ncbi:unnamed protein product [Durusdinium trenchii]|uniref:RBR-type E3 ubiquitin transferase n=1 Tax=Durusdinium trenchii TaxID=1381693 RepID=A0ABP0PDK0_9DINO